MGVAQANVFRAPGLGDLIITVIIMELREPFAEDKREPFREHDIICGSGLFDPSNDPFEHCEPPAKAPRTQVCSL